jgi:hypothetical protein
MKIKFDISKTQSIDKIILKLKDYVILDHQNIHIKIKSSQSDCFQYVKEIDIAPMKLTTKK